MYGKRVRNVVTGQTGIVVAKPIDGCPNIDVVPDSAPERVVCWKKDEIEVIQ